jgi:tetratricopeptide (TPR) repeat protein
VYRALVFIAAMLTEAGTPVIIDATAHRRLWRDLARREIPRFAEVQLIGPVDLARDRERIREPGDAPRGICACAGQPGATVPGVDVPYEPALSPELVINTDGRAREAQPLYRRALAIQETRLGPDHVAVAIVRSNLAGLYASQGKFAEAEPLYRHAMAAREKALGPAHASLAPTLDNYAVVLRHLGRTAEAEARGQIRARSERATRCSAGGNRTAPAA